MAGMNNGGPPMAGGDIAQQLMQLVQPILASPKGQAMAQAVMSQMGGGGGQQPNPMGRGPATDGELGDMAQARNQMRPDLPAMDPEAGPGTAPPEGTTEDELAAAQQAMGNEPGVPNTGGVSPGGQDQGGGINKDGPTPQEAQMLKTNPSPRNQQNFDKLFGKGAAQMVLGSGGDGGQIVTSPSSPGSSYEDHVRGAMEESGNDKDYTGGEK